MKYIISLGMDPELHKLAKAYAAEKNVSLSRLVQESLCAAIGHSSIFDTGVRAAVEDRIAAYPGRKALTPEEVQRRWEEHDRMKKERKAKKLEDQAAALRATKFDDRDYPKEGEFER